MNSRQRTPARPPIAGFVALSSLVLLSSLTSNCGDTSSFDSNAAYDGGPDRGDGSYGSPNNGSGGGGTGGGGTGGGIGGSGGPNPGAPRPEPGADPNEPQAAPACSSLDSTKPLELFLSADDSNSMASPVIARRYIREQGMVPPSYVLRTYEFLNYYNVNYGNVAPGTLGVDAQLRVNAAGEYELQIGVQAPPREVRRPMTLTFVLD
ncbi:MAG TPA: hypothetical protein VFS43_25160, partial [Polyangiaceae bacterium]|nr:hypothetical protein [Polyangiaceae bacterium]